jgi:hypothetical protein
VGGQVVGNVPLKGIMELQPLPLPIFASWLVK